MNVTLYGKKHFAYVIKTLRWEDNPGLSEWAVNVSQVSCNSNAEGFYYSREKLVLWKERAQRDVPGSRKAGSLQSKDVRDGLRHDLSEEPPDFSPEDSFWTSNL